MQFNIVRNFGIVLDDGINTYYVETKRQKPKYHYIYINIILCLLIS